MNPPDEAAHDIIELVRPLSAFTVGMTDIIDDTFGTHDAGDAEDQAILALIRSQSITTTDLRRQSGLSRRAHRRFVQQLIDNGLIGQARSAQDRRVQLLTLTQRGRNRARELEQRLTEYFSRSGDLADEILAHLGEPADVPDDESHDPTDPLGLLDRMSSFGRTLDTAIRAHHAPQHPKNRDQLALLLIAIGDPARPSQLAAQLTLTTGGMTRVLNKLESDRLIERNHGQIEGDRRAVAIELAPDGREVVAAIAAGLSSTTPELRSLFLTVTAFATTTTTVV